MGGRGHQHSGRHRLPSPGIPTVDCLLTLEQITYEAGQAALADQESIVAGVRQRTGTQVAAHALVASFLGATTIRFDGLHAWGWVALTMLVAGLVVSAILLAPWKLQFAIDADDLYIEFYEQAAKEVSTNTFSWLAAAGFGYQKLRAENAKKVRSMSRLSGVLGALMIAQTLAWLAALVVY